MDIKLTRYFSNYTFAKASVKGVFCEHNAANLQKSAKKYAVIYGCEGCEAIMDFIFEREKKNILIKKKNSSLKKRVRIASLPSQVFKLLPIVETNA